jgi:hypothetical protein
MPGQMGLFSDMRLKNTADLANPEIEPLELSTFKLAGSGPGTICKHSAKNMKKVV